MRGIESTDQFRLSGAWNFRDVGGARTADGEVVRSGVLFRSSELSRLDPRGVTELETLGVRHVFDLRGASEIERSGTDRVPASVTVHNVPYEHHKGEKAPHEVGAAVDPNAQREYMIRAYTSYPSLDGARAAINTVAGALIEGDGGVLVHCAAGKDRAGWTVATVLRAVGVHEEDILADYMTSNTAIEPLRAHLRSVWPTGIDGSPIDLSDAVVGVTEAYYLRGLEVVRELYGSFDGYLDALALDRAYVDKLKFALLESTH